MRTGRTTQVKRPESRKENMQTRIPAELKNVGLPDI